jgi:hypothetical protein
MRGGRGVWWFALLGVLVLVDVGLNAAAVSSTQPRAQAEAGPIPTFSQEPGEAVATPSPSETPTPTASSPAVERDDAPQVFLSAVNATEAWRATSGDCAGAPARVERTTVTLPSNARGTYSLTATGLSSGQLATAALTVVAADAGSAAVGGNDGLAFTGSTVPTLVIWGAAGAVLLGIALMVVLTLQRRARSNA